MRKEASLLKALLLLLAQQNGAALLSTFKNNNSEKLIASAAMSGTGLVNLRDIIKRRQPVLWVPETSSG
ncbi:hypothetical protein A0256_04125 [Mucilaginibacter sp. PAMC 26640]|nr:hypothetical protein A0256_04125 [Mucilaginibacter sp. PAMC 26640]